MRQALQAVATAMLFSICSGAPVLAQGFVDAAGLRGAGGFGAGIGAAYGTKQAKQVNATATSTIKTVNSRFAQAAGNKYLQAVQLEKNGKLAEAAALLAVFAAERQQLYGPGDNEVLKSYDRAAALATKAGRKADAEKYMRSALLVCQRTSGVGSPEVKQRMAKLGDTLPVTKPAETGANSTSTPENSAVKPEASQSKPSETPAVKP